MPALPPLDTILADAPSARVGTFICHADDPRFADTGPIQHFLVYFPHCGVWIQHDGRRPFVADLQLATIYNAGQRYTRRVIGPTGDRGDWFAVSEKVAREIVAAFDRRALSDRELPFAFEFAPVSASLFLRQRAFLRQLQLGLMNALQMEEGVIAIVSAVIASAYGARRTERTPSAQAVVRQGALVAGAKEHLVRNASENTSVSVLARLLGTSPYHLCRVFRAHTGLSLHQYRVQHRLRSSIERVMSRGESLSAVAADLGFASHAHYTSVFRRHWSTTPSQLQRLG